MHNNFIIIINSLILQVQRLNLQTMEITDGKPGTPVIALASVAWDDDIYVFGGAFSVKK